MKALTPAIFLISLLINQHSLAADKPNVLLLCIDDLRPELRSFGADYIHSPNIDRLANEGRAFHQHYVQAPTCGASRFALLTGRYGSPGNGALFQRAKAIEFASFPGWFRNHGYTTVSVGKVSHHPGGRGGADWDDDQQPEMPKSWDRHLMPCGDWQHPRGAMHGLANGEIREKAEEMDVYQSTEGNDDIYPDGLTVNESLRQISDLASKDKPFFLAIGIIRPHLPFGAPAKYMKHYRDVEFPAIPHPAKPTWQTSWHGSGEFMKYNRWGRDPNSDSEFATLVRRHYAACVTYADAQVGKILTRLDELKLRKNTIVILWGDHGWHLGEHAVWGKHTLFEESLRSPLIVCHPSLPASGQRSDSIVETIDIFPTVAELAGLPIPDYVKGQSLVPILRNPNSNGHAAVSYHRNRKSIRTDKYRLIQHKDGYAELYDHSQPAGETVNIAKANPKVVERLVAQLVEKMQNKPVAQ